MMLLVQVRCPTQVSFFHAHPNPSRQARLSTTSSRPSSQTVVQSQATSSLMEETRIFPTPIDVADTSPRRASVSLVPVSLAVKKAQDMDHQSCLVAMRRPGHTLRTFCNRSRPRAMVNPAASGLAMVCLKARCTHLNHC